MGDMGSTGEAPPVAEGRHLARHYAISRGLLGKPAVLRAVEDASFKVHAGETLAVVGESGSGKSTLARLVTRIEPPTSGELLIDGMDAADPANDDNVELRRRVQIVFQNPFGSLNPRKKIGTSLEEALVINTDMSPEQRRERAVDVMGRVGLRPEHYDRYPHMFSGGQRQRIAIARALMLNPKLLVADEPVSALDVSVQAQVLNLLMDLQDELQLAYLFISHDLSVVRHIAHHILVLYLGRSVEQGPKEAIFAQPYHPYTRALMASTPAVDPAHRAKRISLSGELPSPIDPPSGCVFRTRCPFAEARCAEQEPLLRPVAGRLVACHLAEETLDKVA